MNKLSIFCICAAFLMAHNVFADSNNISVAVNPMGIVNVTHKADNGTELKLRYKSTFGFNASYERQFSGFFVGGEVDYMYAKFNKISNSEVTLPSDIEFKDINDFSAYLVAGSTVNNNKRLQCPLGLGVGLEYVSSKPQDHLYLGMEIKPRCRYFVSDQIAFFVGTRVRYCLSLSSSESSSASQRDNSSDNMLRWDLEAGIMFAF